MIRLKLDFQLPRSAEVSVKAARAENLCSDLNVGQYACHPANEVKRRKGAFRIVTVPLAERMPAL